MLCNKLHYVITGNNTHTISNHGGHEDYTVERLNHSMKLFSWMEAPTQPFQSRCYLYPLEQQPGKQGGQGTFW